MRILLWYRSIWEGFRNLALDNFLHQQVAQTKRGDNILDLALSTSDTQMLQWKLRWVEAIMPCNATIPLSDSLKISSLMVYVADFLE